MAYITKDQPVHIISEGVEKRNSDCTIGENLKCWAPWKTADISQRIEHSSLIPFLANNRKYLFICIYFLWNIAVL